MEDLKNVYNTILEDMNSSYNDLYEKYRKLERKVVILLSVIVLLICVLIISFIGFIEQKEIKINNTEYNTTLRSDSTLMSYIYE